MPLRTRKKRKPLSMTSLIDVIFLLLLFFMLSSTFSKFSEIDLMVAGGGPLPQQTTGPRLFLRLQGDQIQLNGLPLPQHELATRLENSQDGTQVLLSLTTETTAQQLADVLVVLRKTPDLAVAILEPS